MYQIFPERKEEELSLEVQVGVSSTFSQAATENHGMSLDDPPLA
jgi:hypothetical protein